MKLLILAGFLLLAWCPASPVEAANILFLSPFTSYSHTHFFFYTVKALASRGHTITYWNGLKPRQELANVTHLHSDTLHKVNTRHAIGFESNDPIQLMFSLPERQSGVCTICYSDPVFYRLISSEEHFDLIVIEAFMNECMLPLVTHFNAPFIYMSGLPPLPWMLEATCSPMSFQQFPMLATSFTEEMNIWQRSYNVFLGSMAVYYRKWYVLPKVDQLAADAWLNSTVPLPPVEEIEKNISLFITNAHPTINYQYFKSSVIVEAGGLHLVPPSPLPDDVKAFVDGSGDAGFIVLSFGSIIRGSSIPDATRKTMLAAFAKLPQRVLWKWEDERGMPDLPANVRLYTWLPPLQDLLAHPKMRLLMTHGGLYSNQETVWYSVPLIGLPVFGDQINYVTKAVRDGYALHLNWMTLTEESVYNAITEIITNPKYKQNVQKLSNMMHDQIELDRPLDRAVNAIEYVIRHKGAYHLKPASCRLSLLERELMDVIFLYALLFMLFMYLAYRLARAALAAAAHALIKTDRVKKNQ